MFGPMPESQHADGCDSEGGKQKKRKGMKNPTDEEEVPERGQQVGDGSGETRSATRERKTSPCQGRQRSILDALFGRTGEGTSVGGRQVRGDRCSAQERTRGELQRAIPTAPGHPDEKSGGDSTTALERIVENSAHLETNQKAVALQTLQVVAARANQPGAVRATRCFVVQSKKDETTNVDCSGQRGHRAEHGFTSMQTDPTAQEHRSGESDGPRSTVTSGKRRWRVGLWTGAEQPKKTEAHEKVRK